MITPEIRQIPDYAEESHEAAKVLINGGRNVSDEDALESFQWAEEFMQAVKEYLAV